MSEESHDATADDKDCAPEKSGSSWADTDFTTKVATVGVICVGAAIIEAALIPGMIVGAAAVLAPKYAPKLTSSPQPMFRSVVRCAYKMGRKAKEAAAEAKEHVHDIVAEVHAEDGAPAPEAPKT
jgi:hypothetical protein